MVDDAPRIYLAGPEVFHPRARELGLEKVRICRAAGLEGVFPLDAELELSGLALDEQARRIALANEGLMRSCDAAIANLTPFRGVSMDSGTAYEVGFMRALGRPIFGYSNVTQDLAARSRHFRKRDALPYDVDRPSFAVEDFGLAENLMIGVAVLECGQPPVLRQVRERDEPPSLEDFAAFEACVRDASRHLLDDSR